MFQIKESMRDCFSLSLSNDTACFNLCKYIVIFHFHTALNQMKKDKNSGEKLNKHFFGEPIRINNCHPINERMKFVQRDTK